MSDFVYILEEFKTNEKRSQLDAELLAAKHTKKKA